GDCRVLMIKINGLYGYSPEFTALYIYRGEAHHSAPIVVQALAFIQSSALLMSQSVQPVRSSRENAVLALGALGVVYGDIGTSPLYTLRICLTVADGLAISQNSILGVLSLIFWALIIVVTFKYIMFVMRADNHGEGGILALVALLQQQ